MKRKEDARRRKTSLSVGGAGGKGNAAVAGAVRNGKEGVERVLLAAEREMDTVARCGGGGGDFVSGEE